MKKCILLLSVVSMLLLCGCSKDKSGDKEITNKLTWTSLVQEHPFLDVFPEFHGEIENCQYRDLAGLKTITFFDYNCSESVATQYYSALASSGFTNTEGTNIYRKKIDSSSYTFTGGYSAGNFALSFSTE